MKEKNNRRQQQQNNAFPRENIEKDKNKQKKKAEQHLKDKYETSTEDNTSFVM